MILINKSIHTRIQIIIYKEFEESGGKTKTIRPGIKTLMNNGINNHHCEIISILHELLSAITKLL